MKRFVFFILCLIIAHCAFGVTEQEAKVYFRDCIANLDPIEGCYSIEIIGDYSAFGAAGEYSATSRNTQNYLANECYIVKKNEERDGKYLICFGDTKYSNWNSYFVIENIGETGAYKFLMLNSDNQVIRSCHAILQNYFQFSATFIDASTSVVSSSTGTYGSGRDNSFTINFIKSYPTASMYRESNKQNPKGNWSGSGFALKDGYIVTNFHVYSNATDIKVYGINGYNNIGLSAEFIAGDQANDIALLRINDKNFNGFGNIPYAIRKSILEVGEPVFALGYPNPDIMGSEVKYTDGTISSRTGLQNDMRVYQISIPIQPGNSGGPMFDNNGSIAGITSSGINRDEFNYENVNYAIKNNYLVNLIQSSVGMQILPTGHELYGKTKEEQIRLAKNFVFRIECSSNNGNPQNNIKPKENYNNTNARTKKDNSNYVHTPLLSYESKNYYLDGKLLSKEEYNSFLKINSPKAYRRYNNKMTKIGPTLIGVGAGVAATGATLFILGTADKIESTTGAIAGAVCFATGSTCMIAGVPLTIVGCVLKKNSYEVYNEEVAKKNEQKKKRENTPDRYINLGICQTGIGVQIIF